MKVKPDTQDWNDDARRALAAHFGREGLADSETIKNWIDNVTSATLEGIVDEWRRSEGDHA